MKSMKSWLCLILSICLLLSLTACSSGGTSVSLPSEDDSSVSINEGITTTVSGGDTTQTTTGSSTSAIGETSNSTIKTTTGKTTKTTGYDSSKATNLTRDQVIARMPAKLKNTTIKMLGGDDIRLGIWGGAIKEFEQKTGIKLDVEVCTNSELITTLAARISAGSSPDLVNVSEAYPFVCKNLQPITNLGYDFNDKAWDWDIMKDYTYNGKTYSMQVKDTPFTPVALIFYNKSALRKAEMEDMDPYTIWKNNPADWTWDKFFSLCDTFLERNGNKDGYYGGAFNAFYDAYIKAQGFSNVYYDINKGQYVSALKNADYIKSWEILLDAIGKNYISNVASYNEFKMGRALFFWDWAINLQTGNTYHSELKKGNNLGVVPIPTDSKKQVLYWEYGHGVPVGAQNGEAVPYFIRYIQDRRSYDVNTFYNVENATEVVEWSIAQGRQNKNFFTGQGLHVYAFTAELLAATPGRVKEICDSFAAEMEQKAANQNEAIKELK